MYLFHFQISVNFEKDISLIRYRQIPSLVTRWRFQQTLVGQLPLLKQWGGEYIRKHHRGRYGNKQVVVLHKTYCPCGWASHKLFIRIYYLTCIYLKMYGKFIGLFCTGEDFHVSLWQDVGYLNNTLNLVKI